MVDIRGVILGLTGQEVDGPKARPREVGGWVGADIDIDTWTLMASVR